MHAADYLYKTEPFSHQARLFKETRQLASYAVLWEQGTGKTKPTIDLAADLYERGEIDAVILVAPNGVHRNWKSDELPAHLPDRLHKDVRVEFWDSNKANTKTFKAKVDTLMKHKGFAWMLFSYNGFMTEKGKKYAWKFLRDRRCLFILDEAHNISKPGAKRTKSIVAAGKYASWKRILTGTPVSTGPFDLYSQIKFLDEDFWKPTASTTSQCSSFISECGSPLKSASGCTATILAMTNLSITRMSNSWRPYSRPSATAY